MAMQILNVAQGSDEWKAIRGNYCVASEAPVIMGDSPHMKRDELLRLKSSGTEREFSEWVEKFILKRGHDVEAAARPIAEAILDEELYALVGVNEVAGLSVLSSFDGLTAPLYDNHWEHKQFNKELFELVSTGGELWPQHYWQLEHQLLTNGNDSCIFAVSDGTEQNYAQVTYHSRPERRASLIEGWKLFLQDLANYVYREPEVKPAAAVIKDLPALVIDISGEVKSSNLVVYKNNALDFVKNIKTVLNTDQDFADADGVVKFCERVEKELELAKGQILAKASSIDEVMRTVDQLKEEFRQKRLHLQKLIEKEKEARKNEILTEARNAWQSHIQTINQTLAPIKLPEIQVDFVGAAKGKRTTETFRSAVNDELTRARIEANRIANHIDVNLALLREIATEFMFLFADMQQLVLKDKDAVEAIANQRITQHLIVKQKEVEAAALRIAQEEAQKRIAAAKQRDEEVTESAQQAAVPDPLEAVPLTLIDTPNVSIVFPASQSREQVDPGFIPAASANAMVSRSGTYATQEEQINSIAGDPSDFIRGKHVAFKIALDRFRECEISGADFGEILESLINATKPVATRAA